MASLIPHARLHVIDSGHLFLLTRTLEVAAIILEFLNGAHPNVLD